MTSKFKLYPILLNLTSLSTNLSKKNKIEKLSGKCFFFLGWLCLVWVFIGFDHFSFFGGGAFSDVYFGPGTRRVKVNAYGDDMFVFQ